MKLFLNFISTVKKFCFSVQLTTNEPTLVESLEELLAKEIYILCMSFLDPKALLKVNYDPQEEWMGRKGKEGGREGGRQGGREVGR